MEKAKQLVKEALHRDGHHTVDITTEERAPVTHEQVQETRKEDIITAQDREVHQHHYQTQIQPLKNTVVHEEKHHHNVAPVEHREIHHGKDREVEERLARETSQFRDKTDILPAQKSERAAVVGGEHVHHHIHDVTQPVIEQTTIQPHHVHTVVPIHEKITHEPVIHDTTILPTKTLDEFSTKGTLGSGKTHHEHYEYKGDAMKIGSDATVGFEKLKNAVSGHHHGDGSSTTTTGAGLTGITGAGHRHHGDGDGDGDGSALGRRHGDGDGDGDGSALKSGTGLTGTGLPGSGHRHHGDGDGNALNTTGSGLTGTGLTGGTGTSTGNVARQDGRTF